MRKLWDLSCRAHKVGPKGPVAPGQGGQRCEQQPGGEVGIEAAQRLCCLGGDSASAKVIVTLTQRNLTQTVPRPGRVESGFTRRVSESLAIWTVTVWVREAISIV